MYVIIKHVEIQSATENKVLPVILLNTNEEILEFDTKEEAEDMRALFEKNSTHASLYEVKEL